jgi:hypothetical protein
LSGEVFILFVGLLVDMGKLLLRVVDFGELFRNLEYQISMFGETL